MNPLTLFLLFQLCIVCFQGSTGVKFNDVAGIDEAVEELQEVIILSIAVNIQTFYMSAAKILLN